ncbi:MAG: YeeE/YedE family protein [Burkholderiales bacterium]
MSVDWNHFTPLASLAGGVAIGVAAALYVLGAGRIAGIAGIVGSALQSLRTRPANAMLAWLFIVGLALAPWCWRLVAPLPAMRIDVGAAGLIVAGLLVGFGVRLGNGCTSGHGVCGLSRLSLRSLVNVIAFMGAGALTVFVLRHLSGLV